MEGYYHSIEDVNDSKKPWHNFDTESLWGGKDKHAWFRADFSLPQTMEGKRIIFKVDTGTHGWNASNPQFLLFINNVIVQGCDANHNEVLLTEHGTAGDRYIIDMQAYGGTSDGMLSKCYQSVKVLNSEVEKLYYDIKAPLDVAKLLSKEDKNRIDILGHLEKTVNLIDLRKHYSNEFYNSITVAAKYIEEQFYGAYCSKEDVSALCVGHTHIDVAWLWDLAQTRQKVQRSFATVLQLMKQYPEFLFMSSQPQLYQFLKEESPQLV